MGTTATVPQTPKAFGSLAAGGLALGVVAVPANAASRHGGTWTVRASAENGACAQNFDFKVSVKNGKVKHAGFWPVTATGGIGKLGVVNMTLAHGHSRVTAQGLAPGDEASGDWTSPRPRCTGSWFAKRARRARKGFAKRA